MIKLTRLDNELDYLSWMMATHNVYLNLRKGILPTSGEIKKMQKSVEYNFQNPTKHSFIEDPTSKEHKKFLNLHIKYYKSVIKNTKRNIDELFEYNQQNDCYDTYRELEELESRTI